MIWTLSHRADREVLPLADRHYNRQKPGTPQFVPPGRCLILKAFGANGVGAFWVTSWPFRQYVKHRWPGAWVCSAFRREDKTLGLASELIRTAVAVTRWKWADIPALGMVTFIDRSKVSPIRRHGESVWGYSYLKAGFERDGETEGGLLAFRMHPDSMPDAAESAVSAWSLFASPSPAETGGAT